MANCRQRRISLRHRRHGEQVMYEYRVKKVLKIVDGDTIDVDIDLGFDISYSQRVRLAGIDTPESRTTDKAEKVLGLEVKDRLKKAIDAATSVVIKTEKVSINQTLIDEGYAWGYMGETKVKDFAALLKKRNEKK